MHSDFEELLSIFNAHEVKYLIVGGHAARVFRALTVFGAPLAGLTPEDLARRSVART